MFQAVYTLILSRISQLNVNHDGKTIISYIIQPKFLCLPQLSCLNSVVKNGVPHGFILEPPLLLNMFLYVPINVTAMWVWEDLQVLMKRNAWVFIDIGDFVSAS